ncbi:biotin/lipoyl-binding protein [Rubripirellula amarantea]|uniref:HlyD family secretion protein n=1 Tax=Rubripirellula amarantea TaxID=2527999 RepID=A0A5C5WV86_9BACT|nr:biotin/lipoyl-binding protein [Rubripirellula amarantea]MDA8745072.1 biotin/lipoyl-binding protein [Rubripirellula amarantea]TWT53943.1 HlyD family secretion protein [Rubripirellula amarantea]
MSVNQQTVEETKAQIRGLVNEIAALAKSGATADEFYSELLSRIITALAAAGGAVWLLDDDGQLRLQYQINAEPSILAEDTDDGVRHKRLIQRVSNAGQSLLVPPYSGTTDGDAEGNPTRYLLVLGALKHENQNDGLIEIFQRPDTAPDTQKGYLRFLQQMCELAAEWLRGQKLRKLGDRQTLWQQADSFARASHESLDLKETCYIVANEGRRLIGCDRVSVAIKKGRKCIVQAISGQDTIENRSNIVAALNNLATRVVAAGEPLWHDGATEDLPPQIEEALEDYVDESYGRNIAVLPLREPERKLGKDEEAGAAGTIDRDNSHRGEVIGALIVEQIETDIPRDIYRSRVDLVYEHGTRAIANSRSHSNLFLMPLWRALGRATWIIRARTLPKTLAVLGLITAVVLGLIFIQKDFNLEAEGTLVPEARREVFAPIDGEVIEVAVEHNDVVKAGDVLVRLRNPDLEVQLTEIQGQIQTTLAEQARVRGQLGLSREMDAAEKLAIQAEQMELEVKKKVLLEKQKLQVEREKDLVIRSPIDGIVVSWDVEKTLRSRPIMTGQVLMEIADLNQPLTLELELPEKREGHLDEFVETENLTQPDSHLEVTYILATDPDKPLEAVLPVATIATRAESHEEHGAIIKMRAVPEQDPLRRLNPRPGAKVIAKVHCGRASSGFVFLHEIYEWCCKFFF